MMQGGAPANLGRGKELRQFVKSGCDSGYVQVELYDPRGGQLPNTRGPVIRRVLFAKDNTSNWLVNGIVRTESDVRDIFTKFNVQVDNLCQFMPQDRVLDFTTMNDVDKLKEVQRAVLPKHVSDLHEEIIKKQAEQREARMSSEARKEEVKVRRM